ncbi:MULTISPECIES: prepilin peptidase [Hydrogenophaga]|jgi:leader peptidase (prepilin peptidase)/N-methyltransferase|uniref:Prepilin leader peptidase/N-methyltransferase n=1 Tax=Hydrogenophaga intermedia TaxID=65786 RepID=A0A1L1PDD4_HYDIT|nr:MULTISPECIES: A24 family peptidase [Hydrogenophaga]TMU74752.1 prepilin peptidase [Hydrogenophaga intermedia]CDN86033.1 Type 4 prepilin-like proteins leader peptide-processing enzyme [Hydrogenophaga intermedia]
MGELATGAPAVALLGVLGLLVGSFLNVVIHRLPKMMERQWAAECAELQGKANETETPTARYNLVVPRSACPHCGHVIHWYENIPVLSYLALRGRCSQCHAGIGLRYPTVEVATGLLFAWVGWRWGFTFTGLAWCGFAAAVVALACIDWDTTLLPDDITLPLLWAGIVAAALGLTSTRLPEAVWGAVGGYLSLWLIYWGFKLLTGKEGMGYGDFKLFAAFGAWFGWPALVPIILMASVIGAVIGIGIKLVGRLREGGYVPFGPFLALGGLTAMVFGPAAILAAVGL